MSNLPLIIALKRRYDSKYELVSQERSIAMAETKAQLLYEEAIAHCVEVWEVDKHAILKEERINIILKIERHCKHKAIQGRFIFASGAYRFTCEDCKVNFSQEAFINERPIEDPLLEEAEEAIGV